MHFNELKIAIDYPKYIERNCLLIEFSAASIMMMILLACIVRFMSPDSFKHGDGSELVLAATVELLEAIKSENVTSFEVLTGMKYPLRHK